MCNFYKPTAAVMMLCLESLENSELAALNNALSWPDRTVLPEQNLAFKKVVESKLVNEDGSIPAIEELRAAASAEVCRRLDAGTFV